MSLAKFTLAAAEGLKMVEYIDEIEAEYYRNCGFELNKGDYKKALNRFLSGDEYGEVQEGCGGRLSRSKT